MSEPPSLPPWRDTGTTRAITGFVAAAVRAGDPGYIPPPERIAVFDNDGTLWTEKPMPVQLDFIVRSFTAAAQADPGKRGRQPYKAAYERDHGWLGRAMVKRRDFMRPAAERIYAIPRERVVGSGFGIEYAPGGHGRVLYSARLDAFDDGPQKPLHIWARTGRRPAIAGGNSNGDLEMLRFAGGADKPALRLVVRHDDAEREVDDQGGADKVLGAGFTEISMRDDWSAVFAP